MDDWRQWHSTRSGVYHSDTRCRTGNNIEEEYLAPGRGGGRLCQECRRLRGGDPADEGLDLHGVTFDRSLPDGTVRRFLWGVATAGQQVEGGTATTEWADYAASAFQRIRVAELGDAGGTQARLEPPGDALGHWQPDAFEADLDRAHALGLTTYRLSVEWARVEPTPPPWVTAWIDARRDLSTTEIAFDPPGPGGPATIDVTALNRYREMVDAIRARGMEPIVALNHMALPDWVLTTPRTAWRDDPESYDEQGAYGSTLPFTVLLRSSVEDAAFRGTLRGWETRATGAAFLQHVRAVVTILGDVRWWLTFNEPIGSMIDAAYLAGIWPPGFVAAFPGSGQRALRMYLNFISTHVEAYEAIHEIVPDAMVGCSQWLAAARRAPQTIAQRIIVGDNEAAKNQWLFFHNHYFMDAITRGDDVFGAFGGNELPYLWRRASPYHRADWAGHLDFVAVQYYRSVYVWHDVGLAVTCPSAGGRFTVDAKRDPGAPDYLRERLSNDLGWTIEPGGLREILNDVEQRYALPVLITENGTAESEDRNRAPFIVAHLQQVLASIADGVDLRGYVHWTIADNWEWTFGYLPQARFGLYTVDRGAAQLPRYLTTGGLALGAAIAASNAAGVATSDDILDVLVRRFGTITSDGTRQTRPVRQSHGQWRLTIVGGRTVELVLVPLGGDSWFGMAYDVENRQWTRLAAISWQRSGPSGGRLTFTSGGRTFVLTTRAPASSGTPQLSGEVTDSSGTSLLSGTRRLLPRIFRGRGDPAAPTHIQLVRFEPEAPWRVAAARRSEAWEVCTSVAVDEGAGTVSCMFPDGRAFVGAVVGRDLTGTVAGGAPWQGRALPDDIPFA
jgi:beta-galactosidase